jgi:demethylmenaquinone methyltransferase/2-methoxy-6-polyprenyl-1,4-benzoquinol methylase
VTHEFTPGQATVLRILGGTADDYDAVVAESTFGRDRHWKRWILERMVAPRNVLDLASGTGILSFMVLDRFPEARLTGVDLQADYMAVAVARAAERGLGDRTEWHRAAVEEVELPADTYDHVVSCYLPKYADRPLLARRLARWCGPGARVLLHDFAHPSDPGVDRLLRTQYERWLARVRHECPHWVHCFEDLYDVVRESTWTEDLPDLVRAEGFEDVELTRLHRGTAAVLTARKP